MKYKVLKNNIKIGHKVYMADDYVSNDIDYPFGVLLKLGYIEEVVNTQTSTITSKDNKSATIVKSGIWFKVLDSNGDIVGKATRDEKEAKKIKASYEKA